MGSNAFPLFQPGAARPGDNQYGPYGTGQPGIVPSQNTPTYQKNDNVGGGLLKQGNTGVSIEAPYYYGLGSNFQDFLQGQIGKGVMPFNLSTYLPSTGGATAPGALNAPLTPMLSQLEAFYSGDPATQTWQNIIQAQQRNTDQNAANLREQFASLGDLKGTPFATGMTDFYNQNTKDQNALLSQMQLQMAPEKAQLGQYLQGLDQQSIQNMLTEFIRTSPQNSPYLNMLYGMATTFAPMTGQLQSQFSRTLGDVAGTLGLASKVVTGAQQGASGK